MPQLDGRRDDARDARERRRPDEGDGRVVGTRAFNRIKKAVDSKQIRQFTGNDYAPLLAKGDLAAAMSWSGDIAQLGNKHIHWNVPKDGGAIWTDNMLIPKGGNVYTASVYMNYVYDPKVQGLMEAGDPKRNITGIYYIPPVAGAGEWAKKYDPSVANNPLIFPTKAMLSKVKIFDSKALNNEKYLTAWQNLISGLAAAWASSTGTGS